MNILIERDKNRRTLFNKYEFKRKSLKSIIYDNKLPINIRCNASINLSKLPRNSSIVRVKNRCVVTGRSKSIYKYFKISRILLRELISNGIISGFRKSSW